MAGNQKGGGGDEDVDRYRQEAEGKETAQLTRAGKAKIAFDKSKPTAKVEADQTAAMAKAPAKDMPIDEPSTGALVVRNPDATALVAQDRNDDGDDDGEGDSGKSGKSGSGGGPQPDLAPDADSGYVSFADSGESKVDKAEAKAQIKQAEQKAAEVDADASGPKENVKQDAKASAPVASKGAPAAATPGKTGGPSGGAKGGPGKSGGGPGAAPS